MEYDTKMKMTTKILRTQTKAITMKMITTTQQSTAGNNLGLGYERKRPQQ